MIPKTSEKFWEKMVDTMMEGLVVVSSRGTILAVNRAMEEITGYSRAELVGHPCSLIKTDSCIAPCTSGRCKTCELFQTGFVRRRKAALVKKDGGLVHVLKNAVLLKGDDGQAVGVETFTDITEVVAQERVIYRLRRELNREDGFQGIIGRSPVMMPLFSLITSAAQSDAPTIIYGESGTGKELVAGAIHRLSPRRQGPLIKVNVAALHESLLESELFGHVKGAFTGADRSRLGRFEAADGGDIFLDEVGDMPLSTQAKLLRVLQEKIIERVGDHQPIPINVRLISATNKNLGQLMAEGRFREDLYYRINVIPIHLPPLRERKEDIPLLVEAFIERARLKSKKPIKGISKEALEKLLAHQWPGNVRELINVIEYAFVLCQEGNILPEHLPQLINPKSLHSTSTRKNGGRLFQEQARELLLKAMRTAGGNKAEAARILGVSRVTLWKKLKKYNLQLEAEEEISDDAEEGNEF